MTVGYGGFAYLWLVGNEGMEKKMESIMMGYIKLLGLGVRGFHVYSLLKDLNIRVRGN